MMASEGGTVKKMSADQTNGPVTAIVVGAGNRGSTYPHYAQSYTDRLKIVGVAEPREFYRKRLQQLHDIKDDSCFKDWSQAIKKEKMADCVIIATPDRLHKDPAIAFAKKGYHILLEKPMAGLRATDDLLDLRPDCCTMPQVERNSLPEGPSDHLLCSPQTLTVNEEDCRAIVKTCKENNVTLAVCHVLRYTPWANKLKELIDSGIIGEVVNINHIEPVGFWHFAHSYVRGNWHKEDASSSSLLAKCCHDADLINYWMTGKPCISVSSFGHLTHFSKKNKVGYWHFAHSFVRGNWKREDESSFALLQKCCHDLDLINYWMLGRKCVHISSFGCLSHFTIENKPPGSASRCMDCPSNIESKCPYSAKSIYLDLVKQGHNGWPVDVIAEEPTVESVTSALKTGPYGVCVYDNDNDVMSNQVVNMQFEGGATATLTMIAFSKDICKREVKIYGTKGQLTCDAQHYAIVKHFDFLTQQSHEYTASSSPESLKMRGHGGADYHCIDSFVSSLAKGTSTEILTGPEESLASHLIVFAAEKARKENRVVTLQADGTYN